MRKRDPMIPIAYVCALVIHFEFEVADATTSIPQFRNRFAIGSFLESREQGISVKHKIFGELNRARNVDTGPTDDYAVSKHVALHLRPHAPQRVEDLVASKLF